MSCVTFAGYCGFEAIAFSAEEAKNPSKGLPIAIAVAFVASIFCYIGGVFAITILADWREINPASPFVSAFEAVSNYTVVFNFHYIGFFDNPTFHQCNSLIQWSPTWWLFLVICFLLNDNIGSDMIMMMFELNTEKRRFNFVPYTTCHRNFSCRP